MIGQGLRNSLSWLTTVARSDGGRKSGVIVTAAAEPIVRYLNVFLAGLVAKRAEATLRASQDLPSLPGCEDDPPPFSQVANRLKVLSGLDPVPYQKVVSGSFEHTMRDRCWRLVATFSDGGNDPWFRVAVAEGAGSSSIETSHLNKRGPYKGNAVSRHS